MVRNDVSSDITIKIMISLASCDMMKWLGRVILFTSSASKCTFILYKMQSLIYYRDNIYKRRTTLSLLPGVLRLLVLKGWNGPNSWPSRCVPNPTNSTPQLPADAAGQSGRLSSILGLYYYPQSRQQHSDTEPKRSPSFKPTFLDFLAFLFFNIS